MNSPFLDPYKKPLTTDDFKPSGSFFNASQVLGRPTAQNAAQKGEAGSDALQKAYEGIQKWEEQLQSFAQPEIAPPKQKQQPDIGSIRESALRSVSGSISAYNLSDTSDLGPSSAHQFGT